MKKARRTTLSLFASTALAALWVAFTPGEAKAAGWFNCQIEAVYEFGPAHSGIANQIQVGCINAVTTGVNYVALRLDSGTFGVTDVAKQNRFASMAQAAILGARKFRVYVTDTACPGASNCRLVTSWSLYVP